MKAPRVQLMATCLCDAFFDDVARATVEVLEHLGCEVELPRGPDLLRRSPRSTAATGRPPARSRATRLRVFGDAAPVVVPSGSCARMVSHGALLLFEGEADRDAGGRAGAANLGAGRLRRARARRDALAGAAADARRVSSLVSLARDGVRRRRADAAAIDRGRRGGRDRRRRAVLRLRRHVLGRVPARVARAWATLKLDHVLAATPDVWCRPT